jgi:uncharacterized membrane protein
MVTTTTVPTRSSARLLPSAFVAVLAVLYSALALRRHITFHTAGWDLGIFEQAIRNYAALRPPIAILKGPDFNLLGDHFHPILVLVAPVYAVFPAAETLLVVQAVLFAVAAFPLVRWAERSLGRRSAIAVGVIYGLSFGIASALGFDFHEIAFAVPLVAFSLSALGQGRLRTAAAIALPLILVKEDLGITVVAVIGLLLFFRGARKLGIVVAVIGVAATAIEIGVILPALDTVGGYSYLGRISGHPLLEVIGTSVGEKLLTLVATLAIGGFLAVRSPIALVAVPTLIWRFVSDDANYWGTDYHYSAILMPVMVAALIDALVRLRRDRARRARPLVLAAALIATVVLLPSHPFAELATATLWSSNPQAAAIDTALARIPDNVTVSASDNLIPHLTSRDEVTLFGRKPLATIRPEWIVVDSHSTRHFVVTPAREQRDLTSAERSGYTVRFSRDGVVLLHRDR